MSVLLIGTLAIAAIVVLSCTGDPGEAEPAAALEGRTAIVEEGSADAEPNGGAGKQVTVITPEPSPLDRADVGPDQPARSGEGTPKGTEGPVTSNRATYIIQLPQEAVEDRRESETIEIGGREIEIITRLSPDMISSINEPVFISKEEADLQMDDESVVIGLSIGDDHRAYGVVLLSAHEIVNDVVGGKPVAVTW